MKKIFLPAMIALGLAMAGLLAWLFLCYLPWTSMPDASPETIQKKWNKVITWHEKLGAPTGDGRLLFDAAAALGEDEGRISVLMAHGNDQPMPRLERSELPSKAQAALAKLLAWQQGAGGLVSDSEPEISSAVHLHKLGKLALATMTDSADPLFAATLYLAWQLRRYDGLIFFVIGSDLADQALAVAQTRGFTASQAISQYRPKADEMFPALVSEHLNFYDLVSGVLTGPEQRPRFMVGIPDPPFGVPFRIQRELLMLQQHVSAKLECARPFAMELVKLAEQFRTANESEMQKSVLVRMLKTPFDRVIKEFGRTVSSYDAFLAEANQHAPVPR